MKCPNCGGKTKIRTEGERIDFYTSKTSDNIDKRTDDLHIQKAREVRDKQKIMHICEKCNLGTRGRLE